MDHKNLMFDNFITEIVRRWHLLLEEYFPTIKYIKGDDTDAVDDLTRMLLIKSDITEGDITRETLAEIYCVGKFYGDMFPHK